MNYDIKIYDINIDEAYLGVNEISFVEQPAMEELFIAMSKEEPIKLAADNDKMLVVGPVLIPDKLIYRIHPKTKEEYYIRFSAETIQKIVNRYFTQNKQLNYNLEHDGDNDVNGVIMESWIVKNTDVDQSALYGFKMPVGTWMAAVKVEDENFWKEYVKTGKVKGFSIEGRFGHELVEAMNAQKLVIEPQSGESKDEFVSRCIGIEVGNGYDQDQAAAMCYIKWDERLNLELRTGDRISFDYDGTISTRIGKQLARKEIQSGSTVYIISARSSASGMYAIADELGIPHDRVFAMGGNIQKVAKIKELGIDVHYDNNRQVKKLLPKGIGMNFTLSEQEALTLIEAILLAEDSYTDYPEAGVENAKTALRWAEENGWGNCGEQTGKIRANQIANKEPLSRDTIARIAAFERHRQNSTRELGDGCGRLMWLSWGGDEMIAWAQRKLKQIDNNG